MLPQKRGVKKIKISHSYPGSRIEFDTRRAATELALDGFLTSDFHTPPTA
jgi:hypothetical protein